MSRGAGAESWRERLSPGRLKRLGLGLAVGAAGGAVAHALAVPLAWMLGALFATMIARMSGAPTTLNNICRCSCRTASSSCNKPASTAKPVGE